jgi:hypothetical protein
MVCTVLKNILGKTMGQHGRFTFQESFGIEE